MPMFVSFIEPELQIQGPLQQFIFDSAQPMGTLQLWTQFVPTDEIDSNVQCDLLNNEYKGYRSGLDTSTDNPFGTWHLSQISWNNDAENSGYLVVPLLTFNENGNNDFLFKNYVSGLEPTQPSHFATKNYVDSHSGTALLNLIGDVSGSGSLISPIQTTLNKTLNQITNAGNVNIGGYNILGVKNPVNATDAANKAYVDTSIANVTAGDVKSSTTGMPINQISIFSDNAGKNIVNSGIWLFNSNGQIFLGSGLGGSQSIGSNINNIFIQNNTSMEYNSGLLTFYDVDQTYINNYFYIAGGKNKINGAYTLSLFSPNNSMINSGVPTSNSTLIIRVNGKDVQIPCKV